MARTILYEDENILVTSTGQTYDFVATVENKTGKRIGIIIPAMYEDEAYFFIEAHDWIGLLADSEGNCIQEELIKGHYYIDKSDDIMKLSHDEIKILAGQCY